MLLTGECPWQMLEHKMRLLRIISVLVAVVCSAGANQVTSSPNCDYDLYDTPQARTLNEFRSMVSEYLPPRQSHHTLRTDPFLLRFLSAANFNLTEGRVALRKYFEWREAENLDQVLDGICTDMDKKYPYDVKYFGDVNNSIKPSLYIHLGKWGIRDVAASTDQEEKRFLRYASVKMMEHASHLSLTDPKGWGPFRSRFPPIHKEPARFVIVLNLKHYGREMHVSIGEGIIQLKLLQRLSAHWREAVEAIYLVNSPKFSECIRSWISQFQKDTGIAVHVRSGATIQRKARNGKVQCVVTCEDSIFSTVFNDKYAPDGEEFVGTEVGRECAECKFGEEKVYTCKDKRVLA